MSLNAQEFYRAVERVRRLKSSDRAVKEAVFSEHFVDRYHEPPAKESRIAVAALLGEIRLDWERAK